MFQIIQYDLSGHNREHLVKQVMSCRIAQYLIMKWNQSANSIALQFNIMPTMLVNLEVTL